jgi:guanylate kinase
MRGAEVNGKEYHFMDKKTFGDKATAGLFAEWCEVHENLYGTPREPIDKWIAEGKDVLLDLDVIGCLKIKKLYCEKAVAVFLLPPDEEELKRRLFSRGTDSEEQKKIRLNNAREEITYKDKFDHQVINDDVERASGEIEKIIGR